MSTVQKKGWTVDIVIGEEGRETRAEARLNKQDDSHLHGVGRARCNPGDANIAEIGDELAAARALSDLAHQLLHIAAENIEASTHQPAHLRA